MTSPKNKRPKSRLAVKWASVAAVLTAIILVIDFLTKFLGLVEKFENLIFGRPTPVVVVKEIPFENSSSCLEFAFAELPESFVLGDVLLTIQSTEGPEQISGDMASSVFEKTVNDELSPAYLVGQKTEILVRAAVQATKEKDAIYLHYCPTLTLPGTQGAITVVPTFLGPTGDALSSLVVKTETGTPIEQGIRLSLVRPKNENVTLVERVRDLITE